MSETNEFELCVLCGVETDVKKKHMLKSVIGLYLVWGSFV